MEKVILVDLVEKTRIFVKEKLSGESSGHDYWHVHRVWQLARKIAENEKCNREIVELAALLHDIADWKFHNGDENEGPRQARTWLESQNASEEIITRVCQIIREISFKGAQVKDVTSSIESKIIQDADRLDAIGAIGIARTFAYGGAKNRPMYEPSVDPQLHASFEEYKNSKSHTINHFYEKLLLLKNRMNTETGRKLAEHRHEVMRVFLEEFYKEWNGEL